MSNEYRRTSRGNLVRITPKTFRRGRIQWSGGQSATTIEQTGGKRGFTAPFSRWVGAKDKSAKRVKYHAKK